jgi:acyl-coenzyme A thioesterase PaaI-like protein
VPVQSSPLLLKPKTRNCYACGSDNSRGLRVPFAPDGPHGSCGVYAASADHCGWPGILHGGVTFTLMDEALGWAVHFQGINAVTARAETRFRKPVPVGANLIIRAWTLTRRKSLITARAEVRFDDNDLTLIAETDAIMHVIP